MGAEDNQAEFQQAARRLSAASNRMAQKKAEEAKKKEETIMRKFRAKLNKFKGPLETATEQLETAQRNHRNVYERFKKAKKDIKEMEEAGTIHSWQGIGVKKVLASAQKDMDKVNNILKRATAQHKIKEERHRQALEKINGLKERRKQKKESEKDKDADDEDDDGNDEADAGAARVMKASASPKIMKAMKAMKKK